MFRFSIFSVPIAIAISACSPQVSTDLIISNATIIDVEKGDEISGKIVVVSDGIIKEIVSHDQLSDYDATMLVDGEGGFLIPALADTHVHIQGSSELANYLRYGITQIVNMSGSRKHIAMRDAIEAGTQIGPGILTAGPTLDGQTPTNPLFTSVISETAPDVVSWIANEGYDAIKVYQQMDSDTLTSIVEAGISSDLITTGHVSRETGVEGAIKSGLRYVAHGEELSFEFFVEDTRTYDKTGISKLSKALAENKVTVTPMINYLENIPSQVLNLNQYLDIDAMKLIPAAMMQSFDARQGYFSSREEPELFAQQIVSLAEFVSTLTKQLNVSGVPLILGTDAGFGGAIPGYSAHLELQSLVRAGLSELQALQTATVNAGKYLQEITPSRPPFGILKPGFIADVVLLRENPLVDISATLQIAGVAVSGRWYGSDNLQEMEQSLRIRQEQLLPFVQSFEEALIVGDINLARGTISSVPMEFIEEPLIGADNCIFLGYRHFYGGKRQLAREFYEICAEMHADNAALLVHIAQAFEEIGNVDAAINSYGRAARINPWYGQPNEAIGRLVSEKSD